jgi:hypothetical protein
MVLEEQFAKLQTLGGVDAHLRQLFADKPSFEARFPTIKWMSRHAEKDRDATIKAITKTLEARPATVPAALLAVVRGTQPPPCELPRGQLTVWKSLIGITPAEQTLFDIEEL